MHGDAPGEVEEYRGHLCMVRPDMRHLDVRYGEESRSGPAMIELVSAFEAPVSKYS